ncbi:MAG: glutamate--tRNA ligase [Phycisphaerales bacterium]|nr:glutamate--tRNA ligase [Phycisphaerales bacterium]
MTDIVRTRFAPSPTGYLHLGGARTALFNYLLAKQAGGQFLLRIEDTDQTRNIVGAEAKLLADLRWLGLLWDEGPEVGGPCGPYRQSERRERYHELARRLIAEGKAYYAFDTREELDAQREAAQREKRNFRYQRPERFATDAEVEAARAAGRPVVVRFAAPAQEWVVRDTILGEVRLPPDAVDDLVILKADGLPTYHFAVVADDEDMRITHVLRGQEHLNNTPRHIALQHALGFRTPAYAHLPVILTMEGKKMSKREKDKIVRDAVKAAIAGGSMDETEARAISGADPEAFAAWRDNQTQLDAEALTRFAERLRLSLPEIDIHDFRVSGYLPEVVLNFIALLGWSAGDDREKYALDELVTAFRVERVGAVNARFDRAKLLKFNTDAVAAADETRLLAGLRDYLSVNPQSALTGLDDDTLRIVLRLGAGFRLFSELEAKCGAIFIADEAMVWDADAVQKVLLKGDGAGLETLRELADLLAQVDEFSVEAIDTAVRGYAEQHGVGLGKVAQPLRVGVVGGTVSPSIFETLALLGKEKTLKRIAMTIGHCER